MAPTILFYYLKMPRPKATSSKVVLTSNNIVINNCDESRLQYKII